jgi:hypothetical protein
MAEPRPQQIQTLEGASRSDKTAVASNNLPFTRNEN